MLVESPNDGLSAAAGGSGKGFWLAVSILAPFLTLAFGYIVGRERGHKRGHKRGRRKRTPTAPKYGTRQDYEDWTEEYEEYA